MEYLHHKSCMKYKNRINFHFCSFLQIYYFSFFLLNRFRLFLWEIIFIIFFMCVSFVRENDRIVKDFMKYLFASFATDCIQINHHIYKRVFTISYLRPLKLLQVMHIKVDYSYITPAHCVNKPRTTSQP